METSWVHYLGHEIGEVKQSEIDPAAWEQVSAFLQQHPSGRVIVVGEAANEKLVEWQRDVRQSHAPIGALREVAVAPRFLRPGHLRVFEQTYSESRQANRQDAAAEVAR